MATRVLLPNRLTDARWGYLDKFESNPHMARAFLASMLLVVTALAVSRFGVRGPATPQEWVGLITVPGRLMAVPRFETPPPRPHVMPRPHVQPAGRRPIPAPVADDTWDAVNTNAVANATADATTEGLAIANGADDAPLPGDGTETLRWPDPDSFVPVEHEPELITIPAPAYPELAREAGIEGTVYVRVLVGEDGFVHNTLILQSVLGLDDAAVASARAAVFRPASQQERPVAVWIVVPIEFRLRG